MSLRKLQKQQGFSQRHFGEIKASPYLRDILPANINKRRSPVTLHLIRKDLKEFCNTTERPKDELLDYAIDVTMREYHLSERVKMIHLNDVFYEDLDIWQSSPGLPWRTYGYRTKNDVRKEPENIRSIRRFWHHVKHGIPLHAPDSMAYVRSHLADPGEYKVRAVWGYPMTMTIGEAMFALPLIKAYGEKPILARNLAFGYETFRGGTRRILMRFSQCRNVSCLDFSKFDKTVPGWLVDVAFKILALNIDFGNYRDHGIADARNNIRMWKYIVNYFINTPIRLCDGTRYRKSSGVASGSYFTQLIDSIVNSILINWLCYSQFNRPPVDYVVLGDDSLIASTGEIDPIHATQLFLKVGMFLNYSKSQFNCGIRDATFLGYTIGNGFPTRPRDELLAALAFPERPDKQLSDLQSRAVGVLYASCGTDRYIYGLCKAIIEFKPFDLHLSYSMRRFMRYVIGIDINADVEIPSIETLMMKVM